MKGRFLTFSAVDSNGSGVAFTTCIREEAIVSVVNLITAEAKKPAGSNTLLIIENRDDGVFVEETFDVVMKRLGA